MLGEKGRGWRAGQKKKMRARGPCARVEVSTVRADPVPSVQGRAFVLKADGAVGKGCTASVGVATPG